MRLIVEDDKCWVCGVRNKKSMHHTIPQHLKPVKNVIVPVCDSCHHKINVSDIKGVTAFTFKLMKETENLSRQVGELKGLLAEVTKKK